ncbi:MAG TPA: hypothetical protein PLS95_16545 [Thermoanaerobaculales bacterium]|nr:hypothetical protein [Thermoanaerobaculales bacterium]
MRPSFTMSIAAGCLAVALGLAGPKAAEACSICRCGDPAFAALGLDLFNPGRFNLALDWDRFEKEQGPEDDQESLVEDRFTLTASYAVSSRLTLLARVPWSSRELTEAGHDELKHGGAEQVSASGLSDPEVYVNLRLWSAPITSAVGSRGWFGLQAGVKTDWGRNDVTQGGERIDEHAQPGTGSTDWIAGAAGVYVLDPRSTLFASAQHRGTGANSHGYRYGDITLVTAGFERSLGRVVDGVIEADFRDAGMDRIDGSGAHDPDTGGQMLYVTPRVLLRLSAALVGRASAQIPVAESLNGEQDEHTVWSAGITWTLGP